jgi:hypothetical protein
MNKSDGQLTAFPQQGRQVVIPTDVNGQASATLQLGTRVGNGNNQVLVTSPGFVGEVMFCETSTVGAPTQVHVIAGQSQKGVIGQPLPEPFTAVVFDAGGNPVAGVPVIFTVEQGGGTLGGNPTVTKTTDSDGRATVVLVLAQQEGVNNNVVSASFAGLTGTPASFVASGMTPGNPANTTVSGIVLDNANAPIVNVTASIEGTNLSAVTGQDGRFTIANAPVGSINLFIDGSTSTEQEPYPVLEFPMVTVAGQDNHLPSPIFLPELDLDNSKIVGGDEDVTLTMKGTPGVLFTVFAHSATFPDGTHTGRLSVSQVHTDKVPMPPPNATAPSLFWTVQPPRVKFNPPARIQIPNTEGIPPGSVTEIFCYNHDLEEFASGGTARVSEDGSIIVSDPGSGVIVSGWGDAPPPPPPPTCASKCNCGVCIKGFCVPVIGGSNGDACDDNDACTVNDKCNFLAQCRGERKQVTSLTALADNNDGSSGTIYKKSNTSINFGANFAAEHCDKVTFDWTFDDGGTASGQSVPHTFKTGGKHSATVKATCDNCGSKTVTLAVTVLDVQFQTASGSTLGASGVRVGMPGTTYKKTTLQAIVTPSDEASNFLIAGSGVSILTQTNSGATITFNAAGTAPSTTLGDAKVTALHSSGISFDQAVTVVIPKQIGTPHDTVGGGVVVSHSVLDATTSPACPSAGPGQVCLAVTAFRRLTLTVWDQFQQPVGDVYVGAPVTETATSINQALGANSTYIDPTGVGAVVAIVPSNSPQAAAWPNANAPNLPAGNIDDSVAIEIDGFALNPAAVNRQAAFVPPNTLTITWP